MSHLQQKEYKLPILRALFKSNGYGVADDILAQVEKMMRPRLKDSDYGYLDSGVVRWRNYAMFERNKMKNSGLLRADSNKGEWELTSKGWELAKLMDENQLWDKDWVQGLLTRNMEDTLLSFLKNPEVFSKKA